jgi:poly(hydroxyalkanoate) depolymerase family esterase
MLTTSAKTFSFALLALAASLGGCSSSSSSSPGDSTGTTGASSGAMTAVTGFGSNPGNLAMYTYVPSGVPADAPLVVAMHGCTQSAAIYADAGWNDLADLEKIYVVYPEQSSSNNSESCFNFFQDGDATRDQGEALSIKQMVDWMKTKYSIDSNKVYVTGLSAGGAMTAVMLATYPDVFSAGAVMSGIPYGCAHSATDAYTCMNPGKTESAATWGSYAKAGYPSYTGVYPRLAVWHGQSDTTVNESNAADLVSQWTALVGISQTPDATNTVNGATHTIYNDASGKTLVERYSIPGMNHGTALDPSHGCGVATAYMLDEGICSTALAWAFFSGDSAPTLTSKDESSSSSGSGSAVSLPTFDGGFAFPSFDAGTWTLPTFTWPTLPTGSGSSTCQNFVDTNYDHVAFGRAHLCGTTYGDACADGSNDDLGSYSMTITTIHETSAGNYASGACP